MNIIHQIWIGDTMPQQNLDWCASVRALAQRLGMGYRLDSWAAVTSKYAKNRVMPILQAAIRALPHATTYSLISDWYRTRILADEGGWYCDTDFEAVGTPTWHPTADIALFNELGKSERVATELTICNGLRGQKACRILAEGMEEKLLRTLPDPESPDWCSRYINTVRTDPPQRLYALIGYIGPKFVRTHLLPKLAEAGYTWEAIPLETACNRRKRAFLPNGQSCIWHHGTGTWIKPHYDWDAQLKNAKELDAKLTRMRQLRESRALRLINTPEHLRPQGISALPEPRRKAISQQRAAHEPRPAHENLPQILRVPGGIKRIIVFSNVTNGFPNVQLKADDWCLHCNTARHLDEASRIPGTRHALLVRHSDDRATHRITWNIPGSMIGANQVVFLNPGCGIGVYPWYKTYKATCPNQSPTTGFIAANLARTLRPDLPLILVGFDPGIRHGTPMGKCHAWEYENRWYYEQHFTLLRPKTTCKILVGIMSCHALPERRTACRETWAGTPPTGTHCVFFAGEAPPGTYPPYERDLVQLPTKDDYEDAPQKEAAFFRHALRSYDFEWLYLCDDDTYTRLDRLQELIAEVRHLSPMPGLIGNYGSSDGYLCGGAGMLLPRSTVETLVQHPEAWTKTTWGDVVLQQACAHLGIPIHISPRLNAYPHPTPTQATNLITAHSLTPEAMRSLKP